MVEELSLRSALMVVGLDCSCWKYKNELFNYQRLSVINLTSSLAYLEIYSRGTVTPQYLDDGGTASFLLETQK